MPGIVAVHLYGTMNPVAAQSAYLVTTGSATPAAREWARDKPIHIWDWQYLITKWPAELDELAARTSAAAAASTDIRPGWYVYFDDLNCAIPTLRWCPSSSNYAASTCTSLRRFTKIGS